MPGAAVSMVTLLVCSTPRLPAASIAVTRIAEVSASAGISALAKAAVQALPVTATVLVTPPQITSILVASVAVPVTATPNAFSAALTMPSNPPVWLTTKLIGAVRSTSTLRVAVPLTLPSTSVCTAVIGRGEPSAAISDVVKLAVQTPVPLAVTVFVVVPNLTSTLAPFLDVPVTVMPLLRSVMLILSSPAT